MLNCQICKTAVTENGITVLTDNVDGMVRYHKRCFDSMWEYYMCRKNKENDVKRIKELIDKI